MVYQNNEMGLIECEGIARAIEMAGDVEVHDWISLSDRFEANLGPPLSYPL